MFVWFIDGFYSEINMIDISGSAISKHWESMDSRNNFPISDVIRNMRNQEYWVLDKKEEVEISLVRWAQNVDVEAAQNIVENKQDELLFVLTFVGSDRALVILKHIESLCAGAVVELLAYSTDKINQLSGRNDKADSKDLQKYFLFRDRLATLYRVDLLERVFSLERTGQIKAAIKSTNNSIYGED